MAEPKLPPKILEAVKAMAAGDHHQAAAALEAAGHHDHAAQQWVYAKEPARADLAMAQHEVGPIGSIYKKAEGLGRGVGGELKQAAVAEERSPLAPAQHVLEQGWGEVPLRLLEQHGNPAQRVWAQEQLKRLGAIPKAEDRPAMPSDYGQALQRAQEDPYAVPRGLRQAGQELVTGVAVDKLRNPQKYQEAKRAEQIAEVKKDQELQREVRETNAEYNRLRATEEVQPGFAGGREGVRRPLSKVQAAGAPATAVPPPVLWQESPGAAWAAPGTDSKALYEQYLAQKNGPARYIELLPGEGEAKKP